MTERQVRGLSLVCTLLAAGLTVLSAWMLVDDVRMQRG